MGSPLGSSSPVFMSIKVTHAPGQREEGFWPAPCSCARVPLVAARAAASQTLPPCLFSS